MKLVTVLSVLVGSLIVAGQVRAETIHTRLTREKTSDHLYSFTIKVERLKETEAGEFFEFHVTVKAKNAGGHIAQPHRSGELQVFNGKELVSSCYVKPTERDDEQSFSFRVAAKYAVAASTTGSTSRISSSPSRQRGRLNHPLHLTAARPRGRAGSRFWSGRRQMNLLFGGGGLPGDGTYRDSCRGRHPMLWDGGPCGR
jgi:hypothetical protein